MTPTVNDQDGMDFKDICCRYPINGRCVLEIDNVTFHFYNSLKTYGYFFFKVRDLFIEKFLSDERGDESIDEDVFS